MTIPASLDWWRQVPGGPEWLDRLPLLVAGCARQWRLEIGEPLTGSNVSLVLRVSVDQTPAILKVNFPSPESEYEAAALTRWGGDGAVRLIAHDAERRALLIERCEPGTRLWDLDDDEEATAIAAVVLRGLRRPPSEGDPFELLSTAAARWADELPHGWEANGRPFAHELLDAAVTACRELGGETSDATLLHQDLHGGNVLLSERGWLAIDPKPLVGDPAFDGASLLRDRRWLLGQGGEAARIRRRLDILSEVLELDRERLRRWAVVHALAWGVGGRGVEPEMIESARLLAAG